MKDDLFYNISVTWANLNNNVESYFINLNKYCN